MEKKIDITKKVQGKLDGTSNMLLFLDEKQVGNIIMTNQGNHYEMAEGFEFENNKIYKNEDDTINYTEKYVEGCDMGWC